MICDHTLFARLLYLKRAFAIASMWWIRVINFSYGITLKVFIFPTNAMPTRMTMGRKLEANQPGYLIYEFTKLALTSSTDNPHYFNKASVYALPLKISKRLSAAGLGASYGILRIPNSRCTGLRGNVRLSLACSTPLSSVLDAIFKPHCKVRTPQFLAASDVRRLSSCRSSVNYSGSYRSGVPAYRHAMIAIHSSQL